MAQRLALVALVAGALLLGAGPATGDPGADKAALDTRIDRLRERAATDAARAGALTEELSAAAGRVRELEAGVAAQRARLDVLEADVAAARARLRRLDATIERQTSRLERLRRDHGVAVRRLEQRVRAIYVADDPDLVGFLLGTASFTDLLDNLELLSRIGRQDERLVEQVARARDGVADARRRTREARLGAAELERRVAARAAEQRAVVQRLVASRQALVGAQAGRRAALAEIREDRGALLAEIESLEEQSAALAARIRAAQPAAAVGAAAGSGGPFAWPVSGIVTSGYGWRWGRMHEGIDIAVAAGTPVGAAAGGTVIFAGWLGGYGNLVVVDHGGGVATAYAHNSSLAVSVGQAVGAGQVLAQSGSTGNSSGPHVHFEVRVGGNAVDPLGYV